ncbi:MAG: type transport system permease protein [Thermococcaceae archaeon]|nr:type transport system permease protein [Thermococcaceae archaeon]
MDDEEGGQEMKALNIAMKELYVSIKSKRFVIILSIYVLLLLLLSYSLRDNLSELTSPSVENLSMDLFGVSGEVFATPLSTMLTLNFTFFTVIGAILGASLGADAINKEIESGTIKTLLAHPVYRDEVINGKFLGNAFVLAITITVFDGFLKHLYALFDALKKARNIHAYINRSGSFSNDDIWGFDFLNSPTSSRRNAPVWNACF